jgi:hypothetical protein
MLKWWETSTASWEKNLNIMMLGPFGLGRRNERGKMLIDFFKQHDWY